MEEWEVPEEKLGTEEPATIKTDAGTLTYQFQDGVLYVTDRVQEYLQLVEHDSILYFLDNMPADWRPAAGMKLAAGCSHKLPYGLNHLVLSAEDVGGMLKVVCTKVPAEEVYKSLSYCIDADLSYPDLEGIGADTLAMLGYELIDSTLVNWNHYDKISQQETRAEANDVVSEYEADKNNVWQNTFIDWTLDSRNVKKFVQSLGKAGEALTNLYGAIEGQLESEKKKHSLSDDIELYVALGVKLIHFQHAHAEKDVNNNYETEYTDTWTQCDFRVEAGAEFSKKPETAAGELTEDKIGTYSWDVKEQCMKFISYQDGKYRDYKPNLVPEKAKKPKWGTPKIRIVLPFGPVPVAFIAQATINPEISLKGNICASATYTTKKVRSGFEVRNGERRNIEDEIVAEGEWKFNNVVLNGSFKVGANFRAAAGLEIAGTFATTVGANVDAFFEAEGSMTADQSHKTISTLDLKGSAKFYVDVYGDLQLHIAPLGISLWDKQVAKFLTKSIINFSTKLEPNLYPITASAVNTDGWYSCHAITTYRDVTGINPWLRLRTYRPGVLLYYGPIKDGHSVFMSIDEDEEDIRYGAVEAQKPYAFQHYGRFEESGLTDVHELHFVPIIYAEDDEGNIEDIIECKDNEQLVEVGNPVITTEATLQTFGGRNSFDFSGEASKGVVYVEGGNGDEGGGQSVDASTLNKFKFLGRFWVLNGSHVKEWGVKVHVYNAKDEVIVRRKIPINKNKSGIYTIVFSFLTNWEPSYATMNGKEGNLTYRVTPYWSYNDEYNGASQLKEGKDYWSLKKVKLNYPVDDISPDYKDRKHYSSEWGEILPEKSL